MKNVKAGRSTTLISETHIKACISSHWNLHIIAITPAPRGFVAETYYVETEHETFFAKIVDTNQRYSKNIENSLPILSELFSKGVTHINRPIPTIEGALWAQCNTVRVILFELIVGTWTMTYKKDVYFSLLSSIHAIRPDSLQSKIEVEDYSIPFEEELHSGLQQLAESSTILAMLGKTSTYILKVSNDLMKLKNLSNRCKESSFELVITHSDAPCNILKDTHGSLYLIDWDDVLLAPIERDLWFHKHDTALYKAYPKFTYNPLAYSFYVQRRYLDDLSGFLAEIFSVHATTKSIGKYCNGIRRDIFQWLEPLAMEIPY